MAEYCVQGQIAMASLKVPLWMYIITVVPGYTSNAIGIVYYWKIYAWLRSQVQNLHPNVVRSRKRNPSTIPIRVTAFSCLMNVPYIAVNIGYAVSSQNGLIQADTSMRLNRYTSVILGAFRNLLAIAFIIMKGPDNQTRKRRQEEVRNEALRERREMKAKRNEAEPKASGITRVLENSIITSDEENLPNAMPAE